MNQWETNKQTNKQTKKQRERAEVHEVHQGLQRVFQSRDN